MGRNYSLPTIKTLFAQASHCAYPDCREPLIFEDRARGVRSIAVQIAHIRSESVDGPRFDPAFPKDRLSEPDNLLLLCGKHHTAVDQNESVFTVEELLGWKAAQVGQGPGTVVTDGDLAGLMQSLESSLSALFAAIQVNVEVVLVGGLLTSTGVLSMPLDALGSVEFVNTDLGSVRLVGVDVVNKGFGGVEVQSAGLEMDLGVETPGHWQLDGPYCQYPQPHQLPRLSSASWFVDNKVVEDTVRLVAKEFRRLPSRVRGYAVLGDKSKVESDWQSALLLPIWKPGTTDDYLKAGRTE